MDHPQPSALDRLIETFRPLAEIFRLARSPGNVVLSTVGLTAMIVGALAIAQLPFAPPYPMPKNGEVQNIWDFRPVSETIPNWPWGREEFDRATPSFSVQNDVFAGEPTDAISILMKPFFDLGLSFLALVLPSRTAPFGDLAYDLTRFLFLLAMWALFGGAVTRRVAMQFTRGDSPSMRSALAYSGRRLSWYLLAPGLAFSGLLFFWLLSFGGAAIGRIPGIGELLLGILFFLAIIVAFLAVLLLVGLVLGYPLMIPAISVEGIDAFDGFSRAFSYVYGRPWTFLGCIIGSLFFGIAGLFVVDLFMELTLMFAQSALQAGLGQRADNTTTLALITQSTEGRPKLTAFLQMWLRVLAMLMTGFVYSLFWTASTMTYFILRRADDATDLDEIYIPEDDSSPHLIAMPSGDEAGQQADGNAPPTVGMAASEQPTTERPPGSIPSDGSVPKAAETGEDEPSGEPERTGEP